MSSSLDKSVEAFNLLFKLNATDHELSDVDVAELTVKNKRVAPRYVRDDIAIALCEPISLLHKEVFIDFVELNDIATRGLSFFSVHHLTIHKKIVLNLHFETGKTFKINATIAYRLNVLGNLPAQYKLESALIYQYGVKFDGDNYALADHLLDTQKRLVLR